MMMQKGGFNLESLRYPIGTFQSPEEINETHLKQWIEQIAILPGKVRKAVVTLTEEQLRTPYREGGWTVKQVVHHLADSHLNSFIRFKLALTENAPTIKPYDEKLWAALGDTNTPIEASLQILEGLHQRWVTLLRSMKQDDFEKTFVHPENGVLTLAYATGLYAWHGNHHLAHITSLSNRLGWS
jgi:uncharacterized damage-inducible protein DinB